MASETQVSNRKRKPSRGGGGGGRGGGSRASRAKQMKTRPQGFPERTKKPKIDKQMKRLFQKRARQYNSDSDSDSEPEFEEEGEKQEKKQEEQEEIDITEKEEEDSQEEDEIDLDENEDDDEDAIQHGITRFTDGCRAFKSAFSSIIKKSVPDDALGPVLSGHMKLVGEKLAEEESERLAKGVNKKEKQLMSEKGHVKPANFLDSHEKFLIGVATKGVVKLFNAVNKAQNAQKGLNPSRFKDAKELGKRKKRAFFTELRKKTSQGTTSTATDGSDEPAWAPLRDSYMLTNSKLKNWDKMQDKSADDDMGNAMSHGSSSDED